MVKKIVEDPFLGNIEITKVGETKKYCVGYFRTDTIYENDRGGLYIETSMLGDSPILGNTITMTFLRKEIVDIIQKLGNTNNT